jgi:TPR repeat protein
MLEPLADQDVPQALFGLGMLYSPFSGQKSSVKDGPKAVDYFRRSADINGNPESLLEMTRLFWFGCSGVEKNEDRARETYARAFQAFQNVGMELHPIELLMESTDMAPVEQPAAKTSPGLVLLGVAVLALFGFAVVRFLRRDRK